MRQSETQGAHGGRSWKTVMQLVPGRAVAVAPSKLALSSR
jgi:hypothetical protein